MTVCIHDVLFTCSNVPPLAEAAFAPLFLSTFYVVYANETEKSNTIVDVVPVLGGVQVAGVAVLPDSG